MENADKNLLGLRGESQPDYLSKYERRQLVTDLMVEIKKKKKKILVTVSNSQRMNKKKNENKNKINLSTFTYIQHIHIYIYLNTSWEIKIDWLECKS